MVNDSEYLVTIQDQDRHLIHEKDFVLIFSDDRLG
jgi:hypothetical protein